MHGDENDQRLICLEQEWRDLDRVAAELERRHGQVLWHSPEWSAGDRDRAFERADVQALNEEITEIASRLRKIPFLVSEIPAVSIVGALVKVRLLRESLEAGSSDHDLPLLASLADDISRLLNHPKTRE